MSALNKLLDKYREACAAPSDNACAGILGVTRASVSDWRRGKSWPSEEHIVQMAKTAHLDAGEWLLAIYAERTKGPVQKEWLRLVSRLSHAAAITLIALSAHSWWAQQDSNLQPRDYESPALTVEL